MIPVKSTSIIIIYHHAPLKFSQKNGPGSEVKMCMRSCADQINGVVDDAASTPKKCLRVERKLRALAMRSMDQWIGSGENVQETMNFSMKL